MKRTIVKFGMAAFLVGMFAIMPACKAKTEPAEETETVATTTDPIDSTSTAADDGDTSGGKEIKTGVDPAKP